MGPLETPSRFPGLSYGPNPGSWVQVVEVGLWAPSLLSLTIGSSPARKVLIIRMIGVPLSPPEQSHLLPYGPEAWAGPPSSRSPCPSPSPVPSTLPGPRPPPYYPLSLFPVNPMRLMGWQERLDMPPSQGHLLAVGTPQPHEGEGVLVDDRPHDGPGVEVFQAQGLFWCPSSPV